MSKIYLDYAATTPVSKKVLAAMLPYFSGKHGNAMSLHSFGQEANEAVERARKETADFFGAKTEEIIFTSGATESNNLALKGVISAYYKKNKTGPKPHIITTSFEHHCILDSCKYLENEALAEITYIQPNREGIIEVEKIKKALKDNTILLSVMYVNNEIGTVQPIAQIGKMIKSYNQKNKNIKILFHTDATQAVNYFDCNVDKLGVDLLSMSAHKIYGPKGVGMLYVREKTSISPIQHGGAQESKKRAGTHNVPGIVGLGIAIAEAKSQNSKVKSKEIKKLRDYLIKRILKEIPESKLNGSKIKRSPNNANFSFCNVEGESLLLMLDAEGIAVSTGSACSSGSLEPSHVLMSLGMKAEEAHGSIRITLGQYTTKKDIDIAINKIKKVVEKLRKISGKVLSEYYNTQHETRSKKR